MSMRRGVVSVLVGVVCAIGVLIVAPVAWGVTEGAGWESFSQMYPTNVAPGGRAVVQIDLFNVGAVPSSGPVTVVDTLPEGVTALAAGGMSGSELAVESEEDARWRCEGVSTRQVSCTSNPAHMQPLPSGTGVYGSRLLERVGVEVQVGAGVAQGGHENRVSVSGGGATGVSESSDRVTVSTSEAVFGFANWDVWFSEANGTISTQAGSHPYETTFALALNRNTKGEMAGGQMRNIEVELPPGFFGEPNSSPRCTRDQLDAVACPVDTQIGVDIVSFNEPEPDGPGSFIVLPVYNMVPPEGVVDEFALEDASLPVTFDTNPRGYGEYRLVTHIDNIPNLNVELNILTLWGVAAEGSHDDQRVGGSEKGKEFSGCREAGCPSHAPARPFLTLPTACGAPQPFAVRGNGTWTDPNTSAEGASYSHNQLGEQAGFTGCSDLSFDPSLYTALDTSAADSPAGLSVNVTFPQESLRVPETLTEATVKNTTVTLPAGIAINPGQAAGLSACSAIEAKLHEEGEPACRLSSKVGTVKVKTPLLEGLPETELEGQVYVLEQSKGQPGEPPNLQSHPPTLQLLISVGGDGVHLKLVANVQLNEHTGQLMTTLTETPGVPFTNFELTFSGGPQAALATPTQCGTYTTTSDFMPWTTPFDADLFPASSFQITTGPGGTPCPTGALPFHPELTAGATTDQAGGYTNFSLLLQRGDGQQRIERLQFKAPQGLSGMLSTVPLCPEPQASKGECSPASQIGHAVVVTGPGPYPLVIPQPGNPESQIYLTGPYQGAPFGLSITTHVIAGPFNLGTIITRARIEIDPHTAQITVTTDPLPQIVDGDPTDLRLVDSVIDRPGFMFNPTNCTPSSFSGTAWGTPPPGTGGPGASGAIESHFQVGSCQSLKFQPTFTVATAGKTSKADGASLTARVTYPNTPRGTEANITKVKVELPVQLPSRLTTLQKACTQTQFEQNPAGCPAASVIGHALVHTPVLPVPLEGPVYFVSNGGEAFPNLVMVLQGEGVTIELVGDTFISKAGITSTTFKTIPDQPFSSFEIALPEGPYSALTANGDLCAPTKTTTVKKKATLRIKGHTKRVTRSVKQTTPTSLTMPTEFIAQNGATMTQSTKIAVTGCPKRTPAPRRINHASARHKHARRHD